MLFAAGAQAFPPSTPPSDAPARGNSPIIYVTGQGLYYDSIVLTNLPPEGPFEKLEMGGATGRQTEFGLSDRGHVGSRSWVDANANGETDEADAHFLCPLLGPAAPSPERPIPVRRRAEAVFETPPPFVVGCGVASFWPGRQRTPHPAPGTKIDPTQPMGVGFDYSFAATLTKSVGTIYIRAAPTAAAHSLTI